MSYQPQPPFASTFSPCPECRGRRVLATLGAHGEWRHYGYPVEMEGFHVLICTACGYSALYLKDLPTFQKELHQHPDKFGH